MNANERDEITASVAAHAELGPRYDGAVAEDLVERTGDEIDKRIDARLGGRPRSGQPSRGGNHAAPGTRDRPLTMGRPHTRDRGPRRRCPPPPVPSRRQRA